MYGVAIGFINYVADTWPLKANVRIEMDLYNGEKNS